MDDFKKTPLYEAHVQAEAKIVNFNGWGMPVQYQGIIDEHKCVRERAGLFDVSHMGEIEIKGPDAYNFVQKLLTNDASKMKNKQIIYSPMCKENGGVIDDLLAYKINEEKFLLVVNASNKEKDLEWIKANREGNVEISDFSDETAQLALQGPLAEKVLQGLTDTDLKSIKFFYYDNVKIAGVKCLVSRTGYTGEDGFEIYLAPKDARVVWDEILFSGKSFGVMPIGLGARDTLRFEAKLPLYGNELSEEINPLEAGLGIFVKTEKENFIGKDALVEVRKRGVTRKLVGFEMLERGIARSKYPVKDEGLEVGFVTSGSFSPTLNKNIGLALVKPEVAQVGNEINIQVRNKNILAKIIKTPFYKREAK